MSQVSNIKANINTKLQALKTAGTLGSVIVDDFKLDPLGLSKDIAVFPAAIVGAGSIEGIAETNRDNVRTHVFEILVVHKGENVASASVVEDLAEAILNAFDNDPTLGGTANAGVEPSSTAPDVLPTAEGSFIIFTITIRAKALVQLTY